MWLFSGLLLLLLTSLFILVMLSLCLLFSYGFSLSHLSLLGMVSHFTFEVSRATLTNRQVNIRINAHQFQSDRSTRGKPTNSDDDAWTIGKEPNDEVLRKRSLGTGMYLIVSSVRRRAKRSASFDTQLWEETGRQRQQWSFDAKGY